MERSAGFIVLMETETNHTPYSGGAFGGGQWLVIQLILGPGDMSVGMYVGMSFIWDATRCESGISQMVKSGILTNINLER